MNKNLFGETYESLPEYAKRLVTKAYAQPYYKIAINYITFRPNTGLGYDIVYADTMDKVNFSLNNVSGIYGLWAGKPLRNNCMYVGGSTNIHNRIYRFMKELCGVSRKDEFHPGAEKARRDGIDPHDIYLKFLLKENFPVLVNNYQPDIEIFIDEYVAPIVNSTYNTIKKAA